MHIDPQGIEFKPVNNEEQMNSVNYNTLTEGKHC